MKNSNKKEILYISIIVIQFMIIIFYFIQLKKTTDGMKQMAKIISNKYSKQNLKQFKSITGINNQNNKEEIISFSSKANSKYFIFIIISSDCSYCKNFIEKFNNYIINHEINKKIKIIYFSNREYKNKHLIDGFKFLILKDKQTLIELGAIVPTMYVVNGTGKVLFKINTLKEKTLNNVFKTIQVKMGDTNYE